MKKLLMVVVLALSVLSLSACDFLFIEEQDPTEEREIFDVNEYTRQELVDLVEELMDESYHRVEYELDDLQNAMTQMLETERQAVVGIEAGTAFTSGSASGVIIDKDGDDYYVVTNHHVLQPDDRNSPFDDVSITYERNGMLFDVPNSQTEVLGLDATTDLAVIRFNSDSNFPVVDFANSYDIDVGSFAIAVGNPLGFDYFGSVTFGVVSGLSRFVPGSQYEVPFLQHDAAISPGNSGGALFDINGNLIGINNMKIVDDATTNIGFAIPSNTVVRITDELIEQGYVERPFFGITAMDQVSACGQDVGVCIEGFSSDGTAAETTLETGDIIIGYKLEGWDDYQEVLNFTDLREQILNSQVGDRMSVQYIRDGETYETDFTELVIHPDDR